MPLQDLSVGSTASRRSSSSLGSRQSEPTPEKTSWWSNFKSTFASSGGDDSNMSNPEQPVNALPIVDFGDDDSSAADIYDEPQFTYEPEVYAAIRDASKSSAAYTPDEIIQEAYDADMAGKGEDKPDPLGNMGVPPATLVDVTDTDEGALTNPDPLYKMAEEVRTPTITTTPLDQEAALREALMEGQPTGLMSRPSSFVGDGVQVASALTGLTSEADIAKAIAAALGEEDISPPEADDQLLVPRTSEGSLPDVVPTVDTAPPVDTAPSIRPMLRPKGFKTPEQKKYEKDYVNLWLKTHEGTKGHKSLEGGKDTAAYGVKFSKGLDRDNYSSDAHFAAAVALKHRDEVRKTLGTEKFNSLPKDVQYALVDLNFNVGNIGKVSNKPDAKSMMENTLLFTGMTTKAGEKATLMSLAKRRAWNWNKTASDIDVKKVKKITLTPLDKGARYTYTDANGNIIKTFTTTRLPVKLDKNGKATKLTKSQVYTF